MKKTFLEQLMEERYIARQRELERQQLLQSQISDIEYETNLIFECICSNIKKFFTNNLDYYTSSLDCFFYHYTPLLIDYNGTIRLTYKIITVKDNFDSRDINISEINQYRFYLPMLIQLFKDNGILVTISDVPENSNVKKIQITTILNKHDLENKPLTLKPNNQK